ncbi:LVIVD repeat-containing protein [Microtetraspora niveoalba]|uniref:LVIVD repeat-containing protein n=1 Tax=Microtetraspora niveoalba TaxID=46175 RepID=UPI00082D27D9|nr:hypothetical protein [Microtetraspora niveoalba]
MKRAGLAACLAMALCATACTSGSGASTATPSRSSAASAPSSSGGAARASADLGVDEILHSDNITPVANVPLEAPFDGEHSWNTDLAFQGDYAFAGNYDGFTVHDISDPAHPKVVARVLCPGGQNDVSVSGDLLIVSVDDPRAGDTCESDLMSRAAESGWEGIRIFDISDKARPEYLAAVATECGSHTNVIVPGPDADTLYVYVSAGGPDPGAPNCPAPHDGISIVEVPVRDPKAAKVVATPSLFKEHQGGGGYGGCHDITVYPAKKLAAAACYGDGYLLDISDPARPQVITTVTDRQNFSLWHSATFNDTGTKVVFGDELGGGMVATCDSSGNDTKGANAVYEITPSRELVRHGYFKIPRPQGPEENCVAHNGALIPVPGKDIMVQAWYQGGVSVWDFTDSDHPAEIAFFERGPLRAGLRVGGSWSAYYYNGHIYSSDITKGLDVLRIDDPRTDPAKAVTVEEFNAQTQYAYGS